ncbi:MAG: RluA family pseudouridine synthase, partial [Halobacteriovoraceae bacterium]|nr:RluA family pseudouridine synthase [Halobacteriovoraceae bacterium]
KFARLDHYLVDKLRLIGRSAIKKLLDQNKIVSEEKLLVKRMPKVGTKIKIDRESVTPSSVVKGENIPLSVLYEDEHLLFVEKKAGILTHPTSIQKEGTLFNALLNHCPDISKQDTERPGIVHRLDKGTSGVMVMAKTEDCRRKLIEIFSQHRIERIYQTLVVGKLACRMGVLESTIGRHPQKRFKMKTGVKEGKQAITHYKIKAEYGILTHLECMLETGRTHQIRVQLSELLRTPILCDATYGNPPQQLQRLGTSFIELLKEYSHPILHAEVLGLEHPVSGKKLEFKVPVPKIFSQTLDLGRKCLA